MLCLVVVHNNSSIEVDSDIRQKPCNPTFVTATCHYHCEPIHTMSTQPAILKWLAYNLSNDRYVGHTNKTLAGTQRHQNTYYESMYGYASEIRHAMSAKRQTEQRLIYSQLPHRRQTDGS